MRRCRATSESPARSDPDDGSALRPGEPRGRRPDEVAELRSGELAARAGVSKDTLRFYERRGLLARPPRSGNGYRKYPLSAVARVRMIRAAVSVGFSIEELAKILRMRDAGGAPCREVRRLAGEKRERLRREIERLTMLCAGLEDVLSDWDVRLSAAGRRRAGLLQALAERAGGPFAASCSALRRTGR